MGLVRSVFFAAFILLDANLLSPAYQAELNTSTPLWGRALVQGLGITAAGLGVYYFFMRQSQTVEAVRMLAFATLVLSNILLTLVNRSFTLTVLQTLRVPNRVLLFMLSLTLALLLATLLVSASRQLFGFVPEPAAAVGWCVLAALVGLDWVEIYVAVLRVQDGADID